MRESTGEAQRDARMPEFVRDLYFEIQVADELRH